MTRSPSGCEVGLPVATSSALNVMSSPGAGKTTLLERTISDLRNEIPLSVIEGDQQTCPRRRADSGRGLQGRPDQHRHRLSPRRFHGRPRLVQLDPPRKSLVMIENVGNLVCPALFDLGELAKVVIVSVTEGDDKPVKYPHMFRASKLMILNKIDLLPHVHFDVKKCVAFAQVNPRIEVISLSATRGDHVEEWYVWLRKHVNEQTLTGQLI